MGRIGPRLHHRLEQDYERLRRQVKAYTIVSLVLIVGVTALQAYVGAVVIGALLIAFYLGWMRYLLRGLQASDERLSLQDSMTSQARATALRAFGCCRSARLRLSPSGFSFSWSIRHWLVAVGSIVFFGLCGGFTTRLLVLRRRAATGRP